jgi:hypothetical protein
MVVLPARLEFVDADPYTLAASKPAPTVDVGAMGTCADEPGHDGDVRTVEMHARATRTLAREQK